LPEGYWKRITATFNPWSEKHFVKKRFFDVQHDNVLAMTTTYLDNPYLSETDLQLFEQMKVRNPRRFRVAGLGEFGVAEGLIYNNWSEHRFDIDEIRSRPGIISAFGLDFGYTNDPSTLFCGLLDQNAKQLFVFDEMYEKGLSNKRIAETIQAMGYGKERITADSAEPKSIDELRSLGLRVKGAAKGKDSIKNGIQWLQDLEIIIHPKCVNFITEISNYTWDQDKFGTKLNVPIDDFNHLMDAMRYALEKYITGSKWLT
jgi:phage terminase large subunit